MTDQPNIWQRAVSFAARAHAGHTRKDGETPYVAHPFRVAMIVRHIFGFDDETILAAALLHDVIEDTPADYDDLLAEFGEEVADLVALLTKDMRLIEREREVAYDVQLRAGSWKARLIKLADVFDNLTDSGESGQPREKVLEKVDRAIALAEDDPQLHDAIEEVRALVDRISARV